jgi:non-catalytic primase subunit PriX-like protein
VLRDHTLDWWKNPNHQQIKVEESWIKSRYGYIEKLLDKSLDDFRKYCTTFVFTPYFINIKKLSYSEAFNLMKDWLDRCWQCKRLNFDPTTKINDAIESVKSYHPKTPDKLKVDCRPLYERLRKEGILH